MNFLSIDFSMDLGSLFVKLENKTFVKTLQSVKSNNDLLMKHILVFFKENNLNFEDISTIYVNQGPGSFSGLRTSLAIAKGISLSRNLELYGYDNFIWPCAAHIHKEDTIFSILRVKEKYFIKKFNKNLTNKSKVEEITEDKIVKEYSDKLKVIPKSVTKYLSEKILKLNNLYLVDLDHNELELLQSKGLLDENLIKPLYLS